MNRRVRLCEKCLELPASLAEWQIAKIAIGVAKQVEENNRCRYLFRQHFHSRSGWMKPKLKSVEVEAALVGDDYLAVEHTALWKFCRQKLDELREIAVEGFLVAALDEHFIAVTKYKRAKPVPLGFEDPFVTGWKFAHALCEHRQDGRIDGKIHDSTYDGIRIWRESIPAPLTTASAIC